MSKEVELAKIEATTARFHEVCVILKHTITIIGLIACVYIFLEGLRPFFESNPESISAMADFVDKLNFSNMFSYVLTAGVFVAYKLERNGKKRAVQKLAKFTQNDQFSDSYRSSSGLTSEGNTPK